jgi:hypothetical protein
MPRSSNHVLILEAVQETIQGYNLSGLADSSVVVWKQSKIRKDNLPADPVVLVAPYGIEQVNSDPDLQPTNREDVIGYPITVAVVVRDVSGIDNLDELDDALYLRQQLRQKLSEETSLSGLSLEHKVRLESSVVKSEINHDQGLIVSPLVLRVTVMEART